MSSGASTEKRSRSSIASSATGTRVFWSDRSTHPLKRAGRFSGWSVLALLRGKQRIILGSPHAPLGEHARELTRALAGAKLLPRQKQVPSHQERASERPPVYARRRVGGEIPA